MSLLLAVGVVLGPVLLLAAEWIAGRYRWLSDALAWVAAVVFGIIAAQAVYEIRRDGTVFMTNVHKVFENELFLLAGAYLGLYGIARILHGLLLRLREE
ncbi:transposase [Paenibacillus aurantius]|uniref:Transposase n=1 Tax=Paenibacillus aurantius TaxID=2918900 RepID=A0AA96LK07_9BACL|nr:transposase [Paenibacillus aurantius]WJH32452.1 transposase [Paenibacillus sp. CC-CFT747]WNQ12857.1 transposase [Paenibacillus aurantius]